MRDGASMVNCRDSIEFFHQRLWAQRSCQLRNEPLPLEVNCMQPDAQRAAELLE
jgi:hypothetical protein